MRRKFLRALPIAGLLTSTAAWAAGYDTPVLYSARHMGMGGTAIGYVDDPSAIFHNPAGLGAIKGGAVLGDFSPILAKIHGSPSDHVVTGADGKDSRPGVDIWSNQALSPAFFAGAAYRLVDKLTAGFAIYPVASAGAEYHYAANKGKEVVDVRDYTKLVFIDFAPALAYQLSDRLSLGAAYRFATVHFDRIRANPDENGAPTNADLQMKGSNAKGFRLGAQYTGDKFSAGLVYRHRTDTTVESATGVLNNLHGKDLTYAFILPSKFGLGLQWRGIENLRLAADFEYTLQSQNDFTEINATVDLGGGTTFPLTPPIKNIAKWHDNLTARLGAAYQMGNLEARVGYINDGQASQPRFVSPFGTPPVATQTATAGVGYKISSTFDLSAAAAYRTGKATVTEADVKDNGCPFCGKAGTYELQLLGFYLDFCWRFGGPKAETAPAAPPAAVAEPAAASATAP